MASFIRSSVKEDYRFCFIVLLQLFHLKNSDDDIVAVLAKNGEDFLICGESCTIKDLIKSIRNYFMLRAIIHGSGLLRYFGINVAKHEAYTVTKNADDKLKDVETAPLTCTRRRESHELLTHAENNVFASINSSLGWPCITASPHCSLLASLFQRAASTAAVSTICNQSVRYSNLKRLIALTHYNCSTDSLRHKLFVTSFCDTGPSADDVQICHFWLTDLL